MRIWRWLLVACVVVVGAVASLWLLWPGQERVLAWVNPSAGRYLEGAPLEVRAPQGTYEVRFEVDGRTVGVSDQRDPEGRFILCWHPEGALGGEHRFAAVAIRADGREIGYDTARAEVVPRPGGHIPRFSHVYLIVFENRNLHDIIGNPRLPYLNSLAAHYGLAVNYYAVAHPSEPNYLALWSGSTQGVHNDLDYTFQAPHLGDELESSGRTWRVFAENVQVRDPRTGAPVCGRAPFYHDPDDEPGLYVRSHEPAISFADVSGDRSSCLQHITDFRHFDPSAASFELIVPNMCNDMHSCSEMHGDAWLRRWLPSHILDTPTWQRTNSVIFITWDEGTTPAHGGGQVPLIVISHRTPAGYESCRLYDHYALLRTIEQSWRLPCLGESCRARGLAEFFR